MNLAGSESAMSSVEGDSFMCDAVMSHFKDKGEYILYTMIPVPPCSYKLKH